MAGHSRTDLVHKAILSGIFGHIGWNESAERRFRDDPDMQGVDPSGIRALLRQFVMEGNSLEVREETRAEWLEADPDHPFWYRAIIPFPGFAKGIFVEVKFTDLDEDDPWVWIVSAHRQF